MLKELKWLVGTSLVGLSLLQLAANAKVELRLSGPSPAGPAFAPAALIPPPGPGPLAHPA